MRELWGFDLWVYPDTYVIQITRRLLKTRHAKYIPDILIKTLKGMMQMLKCNTWSFSNKSSLLFKVTFAIHQ